MKEYNKYPVLNHRVIDGDTIEVDLELIPPLRYHGNVRISGIDCPELQSSTGQRLKRFLERYLQDKKILCIYKKPYKFSGGFIGDIILVEEDKLLSEYLLENKLTRAYGSGKRSIWREEDLSIIESILDDLEAVI